MIRWILGVLSVCLPLGLVGCSNYKPAPPAAPPKAVPAAASTTQQPVSPAQPGPAAPSSAGVPPPGTVTPPPTAVAAPSPSLSSTPTPSPAPMPGPTATPYQAPAATAPPATGQPQVRLSAGVGLPQTLPDGTAMGFHVDYQFVQGQPPSNSQNRYFWVIRRAQGQPARLPVQLRQQGELDIFIPWRPEEGPFQSHFEDQSGRRISDSIDMR